MPPAPPSASAPGPPERRSWPVPPSSASAASPPRRSSSPPRPRRLSAPGPPSSASSSKPSPPSSDVGAAEARELVVAGAALEAVVARAAGQRILEGRPDHRLDVGRDVVGLGGLAVVGGAVERHGDGGALGGVVDAIGAGPAGQHVRAVVVVGLEAVVAGVSVDRVVAVAPVERVVAGPAREVLAGVGALERVVAVAAGDRVGVGPEGRAQRVVVRAAVDGVGAAVALDGVVAGVARELVVGERAGELVGPAAAVRLAALGAERQLVGTAVADQDRGLAAGLDVLDAGEDVALARRAVGARVGQVHRDRHLVAAVLHDVAVGAAVDRVGGGRRPGVAVEAVEPGAAEQLVGAVAALQLVVAGPAVEDVGGVAGPQRVVAGLALHADGEVQDRRAREVVQVAEHELDLRDAGGIAAHLAGQPARRRLRAAGARRDGGLRVGDPQRRARRPVVDADRVGLARGGGVRHHATGDGDGRAKRALRGDEGRHDDGGAEEEGAGLGHGARTVPARSPARVGEVPKPFRECPRCLPS